MSQLSDVRAKLPSRSMGMKLIVVGALALVMTIPALFVYGLIEDRRQRAEDVAREVGGLTGGPQTFLGPILGIPYLVPSTVSGSMDKFVYVVFPSRAEVDVATRTEERHRSLFKVPVYNAELTFHALFDLSGVPEYAPAGTVLDWNHAEFLVGASDARGALSDATLSVGGKEQTFIPAASLDSLALEPQIGKSLLYFFGTPADGLAEPGRKFDVVAKLKFSGAQRLAVLPVGKTTQVNVSGDWPHPSFDGGFLPNTRSISHQGFEASWFVPFIARGVRAEGGTVTIANLGRTALGVSFVELADPYQSVTRSLKYALLFIGLVFLAYFLFEVTTGRRVHPAQYLLVGIAQIVFYLLLLAIAERTGFDIAFAIAALATVSLISAYAGWVFESRTQGIRAFAGFSFLYALIYSLLRLEDQALLIGAIASFAAIAAVMYFTRGMDWYSSAAILTREEK